MARPPTDHFIARVMTAPWTDAAGNLHVFDFCTREFSEEPVGTLFARRGLNSPALEALFGKLIDGPIGRIAAPVRRGAFPPVDLDWQARRAIALLFLLQVPRIEAARGNLAPVVDLEDLVNGQSINDPELLAQAFWARREVAWIQSPPGAELFLPETVLFPHPTPTQPPAMLIPLDVSAALLVQDRQFPIDEALDQIRACGAMHCFSLGVGSDVHRVALPPSLWGTTNEDELRAYLLASRETARDVFNRIGSLASAAGLSGWRVD